MSNKRIEVRLNKNIVAVKLPSGKYKLESEPMPSPSYISEEELLDIIGKLVGMVNLNKESKSDSKGL